MVLILSNEPVDHGSGHPLFIAAHAELPLFAIATSTGRIVLCADDGTVLEDLVYERVLEATTMLWHPDEPILVVGWLDGTVSAIFISDGEVIESQVAHNSSVLHLAFSRDAQHIVSVAKRGSAACFDLDNNSQLQLVWRADFSPGQSEPPTAVATISSIDDEGVPGAVIGTTSGTIWVICPDCQGEKASGKVLAHLPQAISHLDLRVRDGTYRMLALSESLILQQFYLSFDELTEPQEPANPIQTVKLGAGSNRLLASQSLRASVLLTMAADRALRFWNVDTHDSFQLLMPTTIPNSDRHSSLAISQRANVVAVGTAEGRVLIWRNTAGAVGTKEHWSVSAPHDIGGKISHLSFIGSVRDSDYLACIVDQQVHTVTATRMLHSSHMNSKQQLMLVKQLTANSIAVGPILGVQSKLEFDAPLRGIQMGTNRMLAWTAGAGGAQVFEVQSGLSHDHSVRISPIVQISGQTQAACLVGEHVCIARDSLIHIFACTGEELANVALPQQSQPTLLASDSLGTLLAVATNLGQIFVFNLVFGPEQSLQLKIASTVETPSISRPVSLAVSLDAEFLALYTMSIEYNEDDDAETISPQVFVMAFNGGPLMPVEIDYGRHPTSLLFDGSDSRFLYVVTEPIVKTEFEAIEDEEKGIDLIRKSLLSVGDGTQDENPEDTSSETNANKLKNQLVPTPVVDCHYVTQDGVHTVDCQGFKNNDTLMGALFPKLFIASEQLSTGPLDETVLRTFDSINLEEIPEAQRLSLLDFVCYMTSGELDEVHRLLKSRALVSNRRLWTTMARICVKARNVTILDFCLSHLGAVQAGFARRHLETQIPLIGDLSLEKEDSTFISDDLELASIVMALGFYEDAITICQDQEFTGLLFCIYYYLGRWSDLLNIGSSIDRVYHRPACFLYARHLESLGHYREAFDWYNRGHLLDREICRLHDLATTDSDMKRDLEAELQNTDNVAIFKWLGEISEASNSPIEALEFYKRCNETKSQIRILSSLGRYGECHELAMKDSVAAFEYAQILESLDSELDISFTEDTTFMAEHSNKANAIQFYKQCGAKFHAIRLAMDLEDDVLVYDIAMDSSDTQIHHFAAKYFIDVGAVERACAIYERAGLAELAISSALAFDRDDLLDRLADSALTSTTAIGSDTVMERLLEYFQDSGDAQKLILLYVKSGKTQEALSLLQQTPVQLTANVLKELEQHTTNSSDRRLLASTLERTGEFKDAAVFYTKIGAKEDALRCLLRTDDLNGIIRFALVSKDQNICEKTAGFLVAREEWRTDPAMLKAIVKLYQKARAYRSLTRFYIKCAAIEINEFGDYTKGSRALTQAAKFLERAGADQQQGALWLSSELERMRYMLLAKETLDNGSIPDPTIMAALTELILGGDVLADAHFDPADLHYEKTLIRVGDVYACVVRSHFLKGDHNRTFALLKQMRAKRLDIRQFIPDDALQAITTALKQFRQQQEEAQAKAQAMAQSHTKSDGLSLDQEEVR